MMEEDLKPVAGEQQQGAAGGKSRSVDYEALDKDIAKQRAIGLEVCVSAFVSLFDVLICRWIGLRDEGMEHPPLRSFHYRKF